MNVLAEELKKYYEEVHPMDFYREIFPEGDLQKKGEYTKGKYNAIALEITDKKYKDAQGREKIHVYRHTVTDDLDNVDFLLGSNHFCVMAPISYVGKSRDSKNARIMYALVVEIDNLVVKEHGDHVQQLGLENLIDMYADQAHWLPKPTFIVASGSGVHLYYQFERPLVLFPNTIDSLKIYKEQLTKMLWTKSITNWYADEDIQQESIFQAFRMPGTLTKRGDKAEAFRVGDKVSIEYMNSFMYSDFKGKKNIEGAYKNDLRLEDAKEKYPEWYEKVIVKKDKSRKEWAVSRNVYDWWLRKIKEEAADGHRYHCLMMLAIYAIKCSNYDEKKNPNPVTREEFECDAWSLLADFKSRGKRADNPFTEKDVLSAIQVYEDRGMITYPRNSIAYKSGITIQKNTRHKGAAKAPRKLTEEMREARKSIKEEAMTQFPNERIAKLVIEDEFKRKKLKSNLEVYAWNKRDEEYPDGEWRNTEGRPTAEMQVRAWQLFNPGKRKADCSRETGLDPKTVRKWWDSES